MSLCVAVCRYVCPSMSRDMRTASFTLVVLRCMTPTARKCKDRLILTFIYAMSLSFVSRVIPYNRPPPPNLAEIHRVARPPPPTQPQPLLGHCCCPTQSCAGVKERHQQHLSQQQKSTSQQLCNMCAHEYEYFRILIII